MQNITLITLCWELYQQGIPKSRIATMLDKHRETIHIWIKAVEQYGLMGFLDNYVQAKKGQRKCRQVDALVKNRWVWSIREREYQCCGQKIQYFLQREHGIHLSVPKIYEVLSEKYVIRSKWQKNHSIASAVGNWVDYYNRDYLHSTLGYKSPNTFEKEYQAAIALP